ncbi:hemolysin family protein [Pedococcus bigeumensis]|uniref:HlyC/CorC family transporter n=1 Tax=Pedococcus bigeumensis TaxID=433644 RepID=A0A502CR05_9MICO|nr:hemolysin family protein [Pedococcus bigeumensis]TPG16075.1 HlyC/CorC family transporter [Pedococcus bigeumensis]
MSAGAVWVTILLLLLNAFFVGAEFAAMAARRSTLEPLAANGSRRAQVCLDALEQMGSLLACAQLGITVCSVLLGAISEAALHHALEPVVHHLGLPDGVTDGAALALALFIVVYLHVVVGEMIPKNLALAGPERSALILVPLLLFITRTLRPIISVMEAIAKSLVRLFGVEPKDEITSAFTVEEVEHILAESRHEGLIKEGQHGLVGAALEFSDKDAVDVAVALSDLVTLPLTATPDDVERLVAKRGFSRYPLLDRSGELTGYLHLKDVLYADDTERDIAVPVKRVRKLATVQAADEVEEVLRTMQRTGSHLARVVDPEGQDIGVVFLEDVIEELVGEVTDASQR